MQANNLEVKTQTDAHYASPSFEEDNHKWIPVVGQPVKKWATA